MTKRQTPFAETSPDAIRAREVGFQFRSVDEVPSKENCVIDKREGCAAEDGNK